MSPLAHRLLAIDFWRGVALCTIFVNHVPGNVFEQLTHRNFGFSDATEVFVLLAGVAAALAYLPRLAESGMPATSFRIVQRAFQIYMAHIVLVIACGAIIGYAVLATGDTRFLTAIHLDVLIDNTVPALIGLVTLGLQPAYLNILPLYVAVLLISLPMLFLVRASLPLAVAASAGLYVASQLLAWNLPVYPEEGSWFLNPLAWQFLFVLGLALGRTILEGKSVTPARPLLVVSVLYVLMSLVWIRSGFYPGVNLAPLPLFIWEFDKTNLFLPRLLHVLALLVVVSQLPVETWLRGCAWTRPVIVLGRHSLPVFCLGTVMALGSQVLRAILGGPLLVDSILIGGGLAAQFALAGVLEWYRLVQRSAPSGAALPRSF